MPIINRISAYSDDMADWRRHLHAHPELGLECHETAKFVVEKLTEFGVDQIHENIATSGVVAIINGQGAGATIGLRADMDALPIIEDTGVEYASKVHGKMHACGHDGHTTMLLGAARYLTETRNFTGRVALIFQPAEETEGGARIMIEEGILERFDISRVYAIHNVPGLELGHFMTTPGPVMAGEDSFHFNITGKGGHAASPHETVDPIMPAVALAQGLQTIVSRNRNPFDSLVISLTQIHTGSADNVIPETAYLNGTVRYFDADVRAMVGTRLQALADGIADAYDVHVDLSFTLGYPPTINDLDETDFCVSVARDIAGHDAVLPDVGPEMGSEDFAYMLEKRPGSYLFLGIGDGPGLHNAAYNYNDDASVFGASYFARLVERAQPL
jgi:amidohydrolase